MKSEDSGLVFQRPVYTGVVQENKTKVMTVVVVNVIGSALNENLVFSILNPTAYFTIGRTSGVIRTTGRPFDRETQEYHQLIIQVSYPVSLYRLILQILYSFHLRCHIRNLTHNECRENVARGSNTIADAELCEYMLSSC